ncbi:hypothetical protein D1818_14990 [Aquimarina sp. BL5]|uniref:hypothetical protein n=1 Tax=Aquimarina sp. BL5 TaxID=1714860 RepID=UPI000E48E03D|nr:hypothetical protein [Aquimarina sp. BL5]AXT52080.1 hypothetical protein D1818_14990 [Aquimarina sp. BL5]RKN11191.1 hypothetical protein D7036_01785 [Aquimarina sp. BL5]
MTLYKKTTYLFAITSFFLWSCQKNEISDESSEAVPEEISLEQVEHTPKEELKQAFAQGLAKSVRESESLRALLKNEALKMFDNDYDVLYQLIKDNELSDAKTVKTLLEDYLDKELLLQIEEQLPTLTIFVPNLPEGSFSAENWDVTSQIPDVAYNVKSTNDVPIIKSNKENFVLPAYKIPLFPVIVIKESERVILDNEPGKKGISSKNNRNNSFKSKDGVGFRFLDDSFNRNLNIQYPLNKDEAFAKSNVDPKHIAAYDFFETQVGWQRDHLYYDLTPMSDRGPFVFDFREHITSFRLKGGGGWSNGVIAYNKIADQTGDPRIGIQYVQGYPQTTGSWTDGVFEFKVTALINAKNGIGSEFVTYFPAPARDLFRIRSSTPSGTTLRLRNLRTKRFYPNLALMNWDLDQYASTIKIEIEEVDRTETITTTDTRTVKYATNFGIDVGFGKKVKIGLEFGASLEETRTETISKTYTLENDRLGAIIANFADDCIRKSGSNYSVGTRYTTGWFEIDLAPLRVQ